MTIAWVTGGGTGIGRALAEALYSKGVRVVISGRRKDALETTAHEIARLSGGGEILPIAGNAADAFLVRRLIAQVNTHWGEIDLLINNAGANSLHPFQDTPVDEYQEYFENNCMSAIRATQAVLPPMLAARKGAIVNISSIYGRWGTSTSASYSVSKFALAGYSEVLRQGLSGTGVHVLGVYPGYIRTAMTSPSVVPGSLRHYLGKSAEQMAGAILRALHKKKGELYYPWYVPWALRLHRWMPVTADRFAARVKR